jgi:hypothetical protein
LGVAFGVVATRFFDVEWVIIGVPVVQAWAGVAAFVSTDAHPNRIRGRAAPETALGVAAAG